ncbi:MAG: DHHA1 domain-containing protein, partial [Candidatus Sumerlaeota bacterium]|nr:DHHA1 domain-containing protein [Candidatus Sumerlaeota bacterium]
LYWENCSPQSVRLRAAALEGVTIDGGGRLAWSQITAEQFAAHGGLEHEPEGVSAALRGIQGVEVGLLFSEIPGEGVRISLRSHGRVDVAAIAEQFGGGGHRSAAGARIDAPLPEARQMVLEAVRKRLN